MNDDMKVLTKMEVQECVCLCLSFSMCVFPSRCLCVFPSPSVCVFLNLTSCPVLPELVTSSTSDSDSCSCKSGPLSLPFWFFYSLFVYPSSPHPSFFSGLLLLSPSHFMLLLLFVLIHAQIKQCVVGFVFQCACVCVFPFFFYICLKYF